MAVMTMNLLLVRRRRCCVVIICRFGRLRREELQIDAVRLLTIGGDVVHLLLYLHSAGCWLRYLIEHE